MILAFDSEWSVDKRGGSRSIGVFQHALALVNLEAWMYREDGSVGFGVSWETIKIEGLWGIRYPLVEGLELLTFEWNGSVLLTVGDKETLFLRIFEAE